MTFVPRNVPKVVKPLPALMVRSALPVSIGLLRPEMLPVTAVRLRSRLLPLVRPAMNRLLASCSRTAPPLALMPETSLKSLPAWLRVMSPLPAAAVVRLPTVMAPAVWLIAALAVVSCSVPTVVTLWARLMPAVPVNAMLAPESVPPELSAPVLVIVRLPLALAAAVRALLSLMLTLPPETTLMLPKSLPACARLTVPVPAVTVVVPAEARIAPPVCVTGLFVVVRPRLPLAPTLLPMLTPLAPVRETLWPTRMPGVVRTAPLESVRSALPVLMLPGSDNPRPVVMLTAWLAPLPRVVTVRSLASRRLIAPPMKLLPGRLLKSLPALVRVTVPEPALIAVAPATMAGAVWVTAPLPALVSTMRLAAVMALRPIPLPAAASPHPRSRRRC